MKALPILFLFLSLTTFAAETHKVVAKLYPPKGDTNTPIYLYDFTWIIDGDLITTESNYRTLDGNVIVTETSRHENKVLKKYTYDQKQTSETGTIEIKDKKVVYNYNAQGKTYHDSEDFEGDMLTSDSVTEFVRRNWKMIVDEKRTAKARYLLLERQESVGFKFFHERDLDVDGRNCVEVIMKPSSFFLAAFVDPIKIVMEKAEPHKIVQITGRTPVREPKVANPKARKDLKAIDAIMKFEYVTATK